MFFRFLDPGPLIDHELELVSPQVSLVDEVLEACHHPLTVSQAPPMAQMTRTQLMDFLEAAPLGHQRPQPLREMGPAYHFWMRLRPEQGAESRPRSRPQPRIAGGISLRIGSGEDLELYVGHIGYHVYPPARGHHYAERSCRLLLPLARRHGFKMLWVTCNPDNLPSRRTCERLGAVLVDIVPLPQDHLLYLRGERQKCRYRIDL
jgi:tagatose 1,6-diphosphate aldolase